LVNFLILNLHSLDIYFKDGKQFYDWSKSERGAKEIFTFQSYAGSQWKQI